MAGSSVGVKSASRLERDLGLTSRGARPEEPAQARRPGFLSAVRRLRTTDDQLATARHRPPEAHGTPIRPIMYGAER